ncbi:MAG: sugar phosphate isomerase/epimerase, partial [Clostridia bacterium]|nr:sugar phosphate isomerase/epimerase [Clostridia bacterium]
MMLCLGSQFYSLHKKTQTEEGLEEAFRLTRDMGYRAVQISGIGQDIGAAFIRHCSETYGLPVPLTHTDIRRIIGDTDKVIEEHKLFGASSVGL